MACSGPASLRIEGEMTVNRAAELKQILLAHLDRPTPALIDLSEVTEIDTAGVQLLILAHKTAMAAQKTLVLTADSAAVREVLGLFGLADYFTSSLATADAHGGPAGGAP